MLNTTKTTSKTKPEAPMAPSFTTEQAENYINAVNNMSSVTRFHGHPRIKDQTIADHSCRVAMLSYAIALEKYSDVSMAEKAASYGLFHDLSEGLVGSDVNATVKNKYGISALVRQVELDAVNNLFGHDLSSSHAKVLSALFLENAPPHIYAIFKLADTLDFGLYVHNEYTMGNSRLAHLLPAFVREFSRHDSTLTGLNICQAVFTLINADISSSL